MIQLVVTFKGDVTRYFTVNRRKGWKRDTTYRELIVGHGLPRTHIPFDNVLYYSVEEVRSHDL